MKVLHRPYLEKILSLELFLKYHNPMTARKLKGITNAIDGNVEEYKDTWSNLMEYELYSQLTSEHKHSTFMSKLNREL